MFCRPAFVCSFDHFALESNVKIGFVPDFYKKNITTFFYCEEKRREDYSVGSEGRLDRLTEQI